MFVTEIVSLPFCAWASRWFYMLACDSLFGFCVIDMAGSSGDADYKWERMSTPSPVLKRRRLASELGVLPDFLDRPGVVTWERKVFASGVATASTNDVASVKATVTTTSTTTAAQESKPTNADDDNQGDASSDDSCLIRSDDVAPLSPSPLPPTPSDDDDDAANKMKTPCRRTSLTFMESPPGAPLKNQKHHMTSIGSTPNASAGEPLFETPHRKTTGFMIDTPDPLPKGRNDPFPGYVPDAPETHEPSEQAMNDAPEGWLLEWDFLTPEQRQWIHRNPWAAQTLSFPIASWSPFSQFSGWEFFRTATNWHLHGQGYLLTVKSSISKPISHMIILKTIGS